MIFGLALPAVLEVYKKAKMWLLVLFFVSRQRVAVYQRIFNKSIFMGF